MNKILFFTLLTSLLFQFGWSQQPYYNTVNLSLTGQDLYFELQNKIEQASATFTYGDVRDSALITDEDPFNSTHVLLVYGYNDSDGNCTTDRSRDKDDFGGLNCQWNREHVFARSLANPPMGNVDNTSTGIGADPHNIRPSDQQMNNNKGDKKFASGSGNAGDVGSGNWYPGDEWKGDVARMIMYMYTRYGDRCIPTLAGVGALQGSTNMLQLFLQWNVDDPVTIFEDQRNNYLENEYGNRNPFIDNPYLATIIWGGPVAEDRWNIFAIEETEETLLHMYPNPTKGIIYIHTLSPIEEVVVYDMVGNELIVTQPFDSKTSFDLSILDTGVYILSCTIDDKRIVKKIIKK
ncbi:MAG: endonuclease [Flavobacteriaceae bacterium]